MIRTIIATALLSLVAAVALAVVLPGETSEEVFAARDDGAIPGAQSDDGVFSVVEGADPLEFGTGPATSIHDASSWGPMPFGDDAQVSMGPSEDGAHA